MSEKNLRPEKYSPATNSHESTPKTSSLTEKKTSHQVLHALSHHEPGRADKLVQTGSSTAALKKTVLFGQKSFTKNKEVSVSSITETEVETVGKGKSEESASQTKHGSVHGPGHAPLHIPIHSPLHSNLFGHNTSKHHHITVLPTPDKHERKLSNTKLNRVRSKPSVQNLNRKPSNVKIKDVTRKKLEVELKAAEEIARIKETVIEKRLALELASLEENVENQTHKRSAPLPVHIPTHIPTPVSPHSAPPITPPINPHPATILTVHGPATIPTHLASHTLSPEHMTLLSPGHVPVHGSSPPQLHNPPIHHKPEEFSKGMLNMFQEISPEQDPNQNFNYGPRNPRSPILSASAFSRQHSPINGMLSRNESPPMVNVPSMNFPDKNFNLYEENMSTNYSPYRDFSCDDEKCEMAKRHSEYHQYKSMNRRPNSKARMIWKSAVSKIKHKVRPKSPGR